jgi:hypothetical protein
MLPPTRGETANIFSLQRTTDARTIKEYVKLWKYRRSAVSEMLSAAKHTALVIRHAIVPHKYDWRHADSDEHRIVSEASGC